MIGFFRTAVEVAALLKEHPGYMCPILTLIQEYQSRLVPKDMKKLFSRQEFFSKIEHLSLFLF